MKNILLLIALLVYVNTVYGQDTLKTEIVFKTDGTAPLKVYKLVKERHIYYGSGYSSIENNDWGNTHYPYKGISYEREYLLTAPGSVFVPNNKEISYVVVDNKDWVSARFSTTTDGKKQVWKLVPPGKNYKLGKNTILIGVAGLLASGVLFGIAVNQDFKYKASVDRYKMDLDFYDRTGVSPTGQLGNSPTFPSVSTGLFPYSSAPVKPTDNRMGYGIPIAATTVSLTAVFAGVRTMFKNSPKAVRVE